MNPSAFVRVSSARVLAYATLTALVCAAVGCTNVVSDDGPEASEDAGASSSGAVGTPDAGNPVPPTSGALIRVVHSSSDAPAVDVYAKGSPTALFTGLTYGTASAYLNVPAGSYEIELRASPSTASDPVAYTTSALALKDGDQFTAIAAGLLGSSADSNRFRVLAVHEDFGLAGADSAVVRIVHASPDAPSVGIDLHNDDPTAPEISSIDRFSTSATEGVQLSAGKALQIGVDAGGQRVTAFTMPALPAGAQLLVIATGLVGQPADAANGFGLLAIGPQGAIGFIKQNPRIYALHAGADAPAVDLFAGDTELVDNISFGSLSGSVQVPPGSYPVDFFPSTPGAARPAGAPAVTAMTGTLAAGKEALLIATGLLGGAGPQAFQLVTAEKGFASTGSRIRAVHASPDAPAVDLGILNAEHVVNPVLFSNLTFGTSSPAEGGSAGTGTLPLGVTPTGESSTIAASFHVPVTDTTRAFAVAAGTLATAGAQPFALLVVDTQATPWTVATIHPQP